MSTLLPVAVTLAWSLLLPSLSGAEPPGGLPVLGQAPLCEASAVVPKAGSASVVLVGDNEFSKALFEFKVVHGKLEGQKEVPLVLPDGSLEDIEALAWRGKDLVVVGSHGRSKKCKPQKKRRWIATAKEEESGAFKASTSLLLSDDAWKAATIDEKSCRSTLFGQATTDSVGTACQAILESERIANKIEKIEDEDEAEKECKKSGTAFNIEGATVVPASEPSRLWVGLRSPLSEEGYAFLLRVSQPGPLEAGVQFDAAVILDLKKRGVREMVLHGEEIWGIAGSAPDAGSEPYEVWSVSVAELEAALNANKPLSPRWHPAEPALPASSEGLVLEPEQQAIIIVDGSTNKKTDPWTCKKDEDAKQVRVRFTDAK